MRRNILSECAIHNNRIDNVNDEQTRSKYAGSDCADKVEDEQAFMTYLFAAPKSAQTE